MSEASTKPVLGVIIASTRPGRIGKPIGDWFIEQATADGSFEVRTLDLAEINLPFMDEPNHPRLRKYTKQHTLDWSAQVEACDAFVLVTCEYNYGLDSEASRGVGAAARLSGRARKKYVLNRFRGLPGCPQSRAPHPSPTRRPMSILFVIGSSAPPSALARPRAGHRPSGSPGTGPVHSSSQPKRPVLAQFWRRQE